MGVKNIFKFFAFLSLVCFTIFSSYTDSTDRINNKLKQSKIVIAPENRDVTEKSINSAVRVISTIENIANNGVTSTSSGTYFKFKNKHYVITSAHSLIGECYTTMIMAGDYAFECYEFTIMNITKDIAIIEVERIFNRKPIKIIDLLYSDIDTKVNSGVHEKIIYTGYPQAMGPFTFGGKIVSHTIENDIFFINSYAWSGSSGSGIFNSKGHLIGIITAVSVANTEHGIDVMEDLVIVTSLTQQDFISALN